MELDYQAIHKRMISEDAPPFREKSILSLIKTLKKTLSAIQGRNYDDRTNVAASKSLCDDIYKGVRRLEKELSEMKGEDVPENEVDETPALSDKKSEWNFPNAYGE